MVNYLLLFFCKFFISNASGVLIQCFPDFQHAYGFVPENQEELERMRSWPNCLPISLNPNNRDPDAFIPWDHLNNIPINPGNLICLDQMLSALQRLQFQQISKAQHALKVLNFQHFMQFQSTIYAYAQQNVKKETPEQQAQRIIDAMKAGQPISYQEALPVQTKVIVRKNICKKYLNRSCSESCSKLHIDLCNKEKQNRCYRDFCKYLHPKAYEIDTCSFCSRYGHNSESCYAHKASILK